MLEYVIKKDRPIYHKYSTAFWWGAFMYTHAEIWNHRKFKCIMCPEQTQENPIYSLSSVRQYSVYTLKSPFSLIDDLSRTTKNNQIHIASHRIDDDTSWLHGTFWYCWEWMKIGCSDNWYHYWLIYRCIWQGMR